jgi:hypothetical protein
MHPAAGLHKVFFLAFWYIPIYRLLLN